MNQASVNQDSHAVAGQSDPGQATRRTVSLTINGRQYDLPELDNRTTILDACREHLGLTGPKKGCDHGQCGACTVLINGRRVNSCLSLAVMHEQDQIETIEGIGTPDELAPLQAAFLEEDAYQCGYCTAGQICSAKALLSELQQNWPSHVTGDLTAPIPMTDAEISERMSGNICRCSAYPNIVRAIRRVMVAQGIASADEPVTPMAGSMGETA